MHLRTEQCESECIVAMGSPNTATLANTFDKLSTQKAQPLAVTLRLTVTKNSGATTAFRVVSAQERDPWGVTV